MFAVCAALYAEYAFSSSNKGFLEFTGFHPVQFLPFISVFVTASFRVSPLSRIFFETLESFHSLFRCSIYAATRNAIAFEFAAK